MSLKDTKQKKKYIERNKNILSKKANLIMLIYDYVCNIIMEYRACRDTLGNANASLQVARRSTRNRPKH